MKAIFEINTITGLRYIELQRLYENPQWYYKERNGNKKRQKDSASNCALTELLAHCQRFSILSQVYYNLLP